MSGSELAVENGTATEARWYALQTRARHEKVVAAELEQRGITNFVPFIQETHHWSDRKKVINVPLFPGYAFVNFAPNSESRIAILKIPGVLSFVSRRLSGAEVAEKQIEDVRLVIAAKRSISNHPFLALGQRVRIRGGALDGVEGILTGRNGSSRLIISIDCIERSLAVTVEGYDVIAL